MTRTTIRCIAFLTAAVAARGQAPNLVPSMAAEPQPQTAPAPSQQRPPQDPTQGTSKFLGKDLPALDIGNEVISWDGKVWKITDNRIFRARFEKFLNAAEQTTEEEQEYQALLARIMALLAPETVDSSKVNDAWSLLPKASKYRIDANLCDSLANAVYTVWLSKREVSRIQLAQKVLTEEKRSLEWNARMRSENNRLGETPPKNPALAQQWSKEQELKRDLGLQPYLTRLVEVNAMMQANRLKTQASELQAKIEFQALVMQFFLQRRFQHVVIASRFYRSIFADGDTKLAVGKETEKLLTDASGLPPTLGVLDSLASEAMRDVSEGVEAFRFLLGKNELASATERLSETFVLGEYMPEVRSLKRDEKRVALKFAQLSNQLLSALEVKDYERAEQTCKELQSLATDFDTSKPMAAIETARTVSSMHLAKARTAAVSGDRATLEEQLRLATEIWPRNPELAKVSAAIFSQTDVQQQALVDLDRLIQQKNYRQIFEDKVRFIAATALYPDRQETLRKVLDDMQIIEGAVIRAQEIARRNDHAGAWESIEKVFKDFPDDNKLNQLRADFTTHAAEFVRSLRTAQDLERKDQTGSSLAWYLKAQGLYPPSEYARDGIERLVQKILPAEG
ncbi:MAG: hypothetical protein IT577_09200 [Verrucomicrobiae bacterium]|nr:hypothetical protein [Verrucomicrobiae bacterium]